MGWLFWIRGREAGRTKPNQTMKGKKKGGGTRDIEERERSLLLLPIPFFFLSFASSTSSFLPLPNKPTYLPNRQSSSHPPTYPLPVIAPVIASHISLLSLVALWVGPRPASRTCGWVDDRKIREYMTRWVGGWVGGWRGRYLQRASEAVSHLIHYGCLESFGQGALPGLLGGNVGGWVDG